MSVFRGMTLAQKQAALVQYQQAYIALTTGAKGESFSYTQGDGGKTVTFTRADLAPITANIAELQYLLGLRRRARSPIRLLYN